MRSSLIIVLLFMMCQLGYGQSSGVLVVEVSGLRNNDGMVGLRLFDQKKGFPTKREKAIRELFEDPTDGAAVFHINDLEHGVYAIGAIHDENENQEFDRKFLGIPKEGFGVSNDPKIKLGPPPFRKAKFEFSSAIDTVHVSIVYF